MTPVDVGAAVLRPSADGLVDAAGTTVDFHAVAAVLTAVSPVDAGGSVPSAFPDDCCLVARRHSLPSAVGGCGLGHAAGTVIDSDAVGAVR